MLRSAHESPQLRIASGWLKCTADADTSIFSKPASRNQPGSRRPASALGSVARRDGVVEGQPARQLGRPRPTDHRRVVGVAHADEAAGPQRAAHLAQRVDGPREVLQHLVRVHDVETRIRVRKRVDIRLLESQVDALRSRGPLVGALEHGCDDVDADRFSRRHGASEPFCDRARAAADVEQPHPGPQVRQQMVRIDLGAAACVLPDHGGVVSVGVAVAARRVAPRRSYIPEPQR